MSKPAERFRSIGSIIGIGTLDETELEMKRVRDELKSEIDFQKKRIGELRRNLSSLMKKDAAKVEDIVPSLNEICKENNLPLVKSFEDLEAHAEKMLKRAKKSEKTDESGVLNKILEATQTELISNEICDDFTDINNTVRELLDEDLRRTRSVVDLLESGRRVIEDEERNTCPLCKQRIERERVLIEIDTRLKTLRGLSQKESKVRTISKVLLKQLDELIRELERVLSYLDSFSELAKEKTQAANKIAFLKEFKSHIMSLETLENEIPLPEFIQHQAKINKLWRDIQEKCRQLLDDIGLTDKEKKVLGVVRLIEQARSKAVEIMQVQKDLKKYENRFTITEKIYSTFSTIKKTKIQEIYNSIQGNIRRYYAMLHPEEPHKNIELTVALGRRASTELSMESFGREGVDPRALTSEGHLDSLGLCIFLGFVKKFNEKCSLIVLDDVVSTVDAKHRKNICKLLFQEFNDKQLIMTTHDGVWYEQLRAAQRAHGVDGNWNNLVITGWDVENGPTVRPYKVRWERIQEKIEAGDKAGAGNEGRRYLEWVLERVCETIRVPIVFKTSGPYGIGDLLLPSKKRIAKLVKDEAFKNEVLEIFQDLESTILLGNLLSHNNLLAEEVTRGEVKDFCESVQNFHHVFLCPCCEQFLGYYKNLKILRCPNSRCEEPYEVKTK